MIDQLHRPGKKVDAILLQRRSEELLLAFTEFRHRILPRIEAKVMLQDIIVPQPKRWSKSVIA